MGTIQSSIGDSFFLCMSPTSLQLQFPFPGNFDLVCNVIGEAIVTSCVTAMLSSSSPSPAMSHWKFIIIQNYCQAKSTEYGRQRSAPIQFGPGIIVGAPSRSSQIVLKEKHMKQHPFSALVIGFNIWISAIRDPVAPLLFATDRARFHPARLCSSFGSISSIRGATEPPLSICPSSL